MNDYSMVEMSNTLSCLMEFKQAYTEENGLLTVGNIKDLIDKIDLIVYCVNKQRYIPTNDVRHLKLFGSMEWNKYCRTCGTMLNPEQGCFCPRCGQKFYQ